VRVLQLNKYFYPPHVGGVEHSLLLLSRELASRDGIEVTAIVANEGRKAVREEIDGVDVVRVGRLAAYASTPVAPALRRTLRREARSVPPANVVHLHFPYPWGEVSWLSSGLDVPSVLTYHSDIVRQRLLGAAYAPLLRRVLARVDRIIVGSPQMIETSRFLEPHAEKCRVVPFGIDVDFYAGNEDTTLRAQRLGEGHSRPIVLFVGRLVYYKGIDVLIEAMRSVDADLVVVGRGPLLEPMQSKVREYDMSDRVTIIESLDDEQLVDWYHAADVFCLPSVAASEAYGLVQLEAHCAGTPVVSTSLPTGVPFVNPDGVTGLIVPPGDSAALAAALARLIDEPDLRQRLGSAARRRALSEFSIEHMTDLVLGVYEEAIVLHAERTARAQEGRS
jgi:glycosyltransferase involved in cell wall biosynthesis